LQGRIFVLVVVDRDTGEFTVEGPMADDRPWNKAVVALRGSAVTFAALAWGTCRPRRGGRMASRAWQPADRRGLDRNPELTPLAKPVCRRTGFLEHQRPQAAFWKADNGRDNNTAKIAGAACLRPHRFFSRQTTSVTPLLTTIHQVAGISTYSSTTTRYPRHRSYLNQYVVSGGHNATVKQIVPLQRRASIERRLEHGDPHYACQLQRH
jgi:hypothetical protein